MKFVVLSLFGFAGIIAAFVTIPAYAQEPSVMTDEHIARIRSNCPGALSTLARIHANDAPIFINRNQTYFSVSDKLMARLNSRLALNRYDTSQLVKTASDYNAQVLRLRVVYKQYDDSMTDLLRINCRLQPVSFYDKVATTRELRKKVNDSIVRLKQGLDQYEQDLKSFKQEHFKGAKL